ncbi:MAG: sporulation histidine kinase inhibitor Sda [Bacillota bacterium]
MIQLISNELLINTYYKAKALNLDPYFISLLEVEMKKRNLDQYGIKLSSDVFYMPNR